MTFCTQTTMDVPEQFEVKEPAGHALLAPEIVSEFLFGIVMGIGLLVLLIILFGALYIAKSLAGIDVFPNYHLGDYIPLLTIFRVN